MEKRLATGFHNENMLQTINGVYRISSYLSFFKPQNIIFLGIVIINVIHTKSLQLSPGFMGFSELKMEGEILYGKFLKIIFLF